MGAVRPKSERKSQYALTNHQLKNFQILNCSFPDICFTKAAVGARRELACSRSPDKVCERSISPVGRNAILSCCWWKVFDRVYSNVKAQNSPAGVLGVEFNEPRN